jgi:hypothetical protein
MRLLLLSEPLRIWRDHVLKTFGPALLLPSGLATTAAPPQALQIVGFLAVDQDFFALHSF